MKYDPVQIAIGEQLSPYMTELRYRMLDESSKLNVSDEVITDFLKFISSKYNEIDFSEIEKSKGDITKFKYYEVLTQNIEMLKEIYAAHDSVIYKDYVESCVTILDYLHHNVRPYSQAYLDEIGFLQINYVTMITTVIYAISILITATIRFVSIDNSSEIEAIVEDLSKHANYVFLKNSRAYAAVIRSGEMDTMTKAFIKSTDSVKNEAFMATTAGITILAVPIVIFLILRLIPIIREVIYSVYFIRVKITEVLELQIMLINTNLEALENSDPNAKKKKIIVKQKKVVAALTNMRNFFMVRVESAEPQMRREIQKEDKEIKNNTGSLPNKTPDIMI